MARKIPDIGSTGVGDISAVMQDRGLSDLSWLDVDPEDYRAKEALPKQNLDIIPELQRALTYDDSGVPALIPLRPHTLVNTNPLDAPSAVSKTSSAEVANKVARHLMSGSAPRQVGEKLMLEFSPGQIRHASASISSVLSERGLIGNVYVDSKHFPRCSQNSDDKKFVATRAAGAKFVLSKSECSGCLHNRGGMCANLHKQIVHSVPYDKKTFAHYAVQLSSEGRLDSAGLDAALTGSDFDRRRVLKSSFSTPALQAKADSSGLYLRHQAKVAKPAVTDEQADAYLARPRSDQPVLGRGFTAAVKHLMLGGSPDPLHGSLDDSVRRVASEHGLLGHTYLDMDALGGCGVTLSFLSRMDYMPDFIVRRSSCCEECKGASDGACAQIQKICHISDRSDIGKENFVAALLRAADRGAIDIEQARHAASKAPAKSNWRRLTAQANFLQPVEGKATYSGARVSAHYGAIVPAKEMTPSKPMDAEEVRRSISHMMNTGLRGKALAAAILQRYARSDLARVPRVGASLAGNDGVQGTYFIDPTAYSDYGRGCVIGAKKFRKIGAENVFAGESCIGCAMQTAPGWCAKYAKSLIRSVPASVAAAAAEAKRRPVACSDAPVDNPVDSYQLSASITVEPDKSRVLPSVQFADSDALDAV